jgi:hypothetical protein
MSLSKRANAPMPGIPEKIDRMSTRYDLVWQQTSPGVYEREIDEAEMFYSSLAKTYEGTGRTYFAITAHLGFSVPLSVQVPTLRTEQRLEHALRKAWKKLRYDHPTLAAPVKYESSIKWCRKIYQIPEDGGEAWLQETFRLVTGQSGVDFANSDPTVGPYATLYLINPPLEPNHFAQNILRRDIVFRCTHDLIDGIGTLTLLNNFIRHASQAYLMGDSYPETVFGDEHKNLSPPFRIAAHLSTRPTTLQLQRFDSIQAANDRVRLSSKVLSIPYASRAPSHGRCQRIAISLTAVQTAILIRKCKDRGVTPTHAFHAGIALAVRDAQERTKQEAKANYISYALVNLRSTCMIPYNTPLHAASVYHCVSGHNLVVPLTIPSSLEALREYSPNEFLSVLETVSSFYRDIKIDADYLSTVPALFASKSPPYPAVPGPVPPPNSSPTASLSSMGLVDKIVAPSRGDFSITTQPWVIGAEYSPGIGVFLGTWKGVMEVSAAYNEAFRSEEEIRSFLAQIKDIVLKGLGADIYF